MSDQNESLEQIKQQLQEGSLNERRLALNTLQSYDPAIAVPVLVSLLDSPDFSLRKFVAMGLGNHRSNESFQVLAKMASQENDANVLAEVANSLYEFGDRATDILVEMFENHEHWLLRQTILSLVAESQNEPKIWDVALQALEDPHQTVKETGIFALGLLLKGTLKEQALAELEALANHENWRTRWRVAIALQHGDPNTVSFLLHKLQTDPHFRVVSAAMDVLNSF